MERSVYVGSVVTSHGRQNEDTNRKKIGAVMAYELLTRNLWERKEMSLKTEMTSRIKTFGSGWNFRLKC